MATDRSIAALALLPDPPPDLWIGTDEAGKGDYFGPLVVAGVCVALEQVDGLIALGVDDSKRLDDTLIKEIAPRIRADLEHEIVVIPPLEYNAQYPRFKNLNHLLAWAHGRAVEALLSRTAATFVLTDQFTNVQTMWQHFGPLGRAAHFSQRTQAEANLGVAAASVLARAAFLEGIAALEAAHGVTLRLGAGRHVTDAAQQIAGAHGREILDALVKLHFKNSQRLWL